MTGRLKRAPLLAAAVLAIGAATALAAGNSVHLHVADNPKVNKPYTIKLRGHAVGTKVLYIFVDTHRCAATPAKEHTRANGFIWRNVKGDYLRAASVTSPTSGRRHACAYLVKNSAPPNPSTGVVASDSEGYSVS